ncbi:aldose epimerase family protein [Sinomicrobium soli]|uniref:aldose epimerase family protein n=1 Tax=Sinomicrobium sp. N-1-3-6 TaxID=2219864 RepID=UPI000DCE47D3|nr:aldose epimerase family protein [Sinomicrobium sp. N-1-3-6]RAV29288.1 galactose-1-epimerase [Sinomicrobium sp. N-1-3-6]
MKTYYLSLAMLALVACNQKAKKQDDTTVPADTVTVAMKASVSKEKFGTLPDGKEVDRYTLTNANGISMKVMTYGGIITSLQTPDKNGEQGDIVLGFDSLEGYLQKGVPYFGAVIGRYGNRIAKGKFELDGKTYTLATNDGPNHLHGGKKGFDKVVWTASEKKTDHGVALQLEYLSKDMEEGYPGNLKATVTYTLTDDNELQVDYQATTDKKTVVNLTQHSYFNLAPGTATILDHEVTLHADAFLPVSNTLIPTGELRPVEGTPFDFRKGKKVGQDIGQEDQQLEYGGGFDHCWVLNGAGEGLEKAASLYDASTGRLMEVFTTEPAIQFYSGNFLDGSLTGKNGEKYVHRSGLCLETEHYPDAPNQPDFPSTVLNPGEEYHTTTVFRFSVK